VRWLSACRRLSPNGRILFLTTSNSKTTAKLSPVYIISTLLVSNYIGICFARTLHYQFYAWYFHSLPFLLWYHTLGSSTNAGATASVPGLLGYPVASRVALLCAIEGAFLTFPATPTSSAILQLAQLGILIQIRPPNEFVAITEASPSTGSSGTVKGRKRD
jgi:ALG3 protein